MPKVTFNKAKDLIKSLENGNYPYEELNQFKNNYIDNLKGNATDILVNYIIGESNA